MTEIASPSAILGRVLAASLLALQRVRSPRPVHPHGVALSGTLRFTTQGSVSGLPFLDDPPTSQIAVTARVSRSIGLPLPLPDVLGLALRLPVPSGFADVLLASTGFGMPSRFWLAVHRSPSRARFTSFFPYKSDRGPVLLAARTIGPTDLPAEPTALAHALETTTWRLHLYHATPSGRWHPFAVLELGRTPGPVDTTDRYDPIRHPLPGRTTYAWTRRLRQRSYAEIQEERS